MQKISKKNLVLMVSLLFCVAVVIFLKSTERYNFVVTTKSMNENEFGEVYFDCTISSNLLYDRKILKGSVKIVLENNVEITYEFCNPITNISKDTYMVHIAGTNAVPSAEYGLTVPTGFLYFEEDMDTFLLSQTHPYLGDFVGVKKGEVSDEIIQKYAEIVDLSE